MPKDMEFSSRRRFVWPIGVGLLWFFFLLALALWSARSEQTHFMTMAERRAKTLFRQLVLIRSWNANHGGIFVKAGSGTLPNEYLKPGERTVTTSDGEVLIKLNPAYMTRQLGLISMDRGHVGFHITALEPVRPDNLPDTWETECLMGFEQGLEERFQLIDGGGTKVFRYMAPLKLEDKCRNCHPEESLRGKTTLGGISVSFPAESMIDSRKDSVARTHIAFSMIGLVGMVGIMGSTYQILRKRDEAQRADHAKSTFLANMSHDMRTPLNGIMGLTELIQRRGLSPEQERHANLVLQSAQNLLEIVNDITEFSRLESGRLALRPSDFDFRALMEDILAVYRFPSESKGLELYSEMDRNIPPVLHGDSFRIKQVIANLVGNAIKFTPRGKVGIRVNVVELSREDETPSVRLAVQVQDTGIGIAESDIGRIFDSFCQVDESYAKKHGGTGLGLSICHRLVRMMGGGIDVDSTPGQGTTFRFEIVLGISEDSERDISVEPHGSLPPVIVPRTILVVEDNSLNRCFFLDVLKGAGHDVRAVSSGWDACGELVAARCDLVLMDIQIPDMDGLEITQYIRKGGCGPDRDVPVVAVTASVGPEIEHDCLEAGMNGYLTKPISSRELLAAVAHYTSGDQGGTMADVHSSGGLAAQDTERLLDRDAALEGLGGKEELYVRLVQTFLEDTPPKIQLLSRALQEKDWAEVARLAHALKNSAALIYALRMSEAARKMERAACGRDDGTKERLLAELESACAATLEVLRTNEGK